VNWWINCFKRQAAEQGIKLHFANITQNELIGAFKAEQFHWYLLVHFYWIEKKRRMGGHERLDDDCLYMHDPDPDDGRQSEIDCQFIPIAREDFDRMSCFGKNRLRTE